MDGNRGLSSGVASTNLKSLREETKTDVAALIEKRSAPVSATRENLKRITMIVEEGFHHRLKKHAVDARQTLEDCYREALNDYMKKHKIP